MKRMLIAMGICLVFSTIGYLLYEWSGHISFVFDFGLAAGLLYSSIVK